MHIHAYMYTASPSAPAAMARRASASSAASSPCRCWAAEGYD